VRFRLPWLAVVALAACTGEAERAPAAGAEALSDPTGVVGPAIGEPELASPDAPLGVLPAEPEAVLDRRPDGAALFATVLPAPIGGDPERVMTLRADAFPGLDGRRVLDARFADDGVVTLGADHVLRFARADGTETELDAAAEGPLSVVGELVAYTRGEMPFFELARANVRTSAIEELTNGLAPVWSPALSADGREVVFASSASGHPTLMRLGATGELTTLASTRTPSSPRAPTWTGDLLTFEDETGTTTVDVTIASAP